MGSKYTWIQVRIIYDIYLWYILDFFSGNLKNEISRLRWGKRQRILGF